MSVKDIYHKESNLLNAEDLQKKAHKVVIADIAIEEIGEKKEKKLVVGLKGKAKRLVLNKTNAEVIADAYGDEEFSWIDKEIVMYPTVVEFQGKPTPCIRVRVDMPVVEEEIGEENIPF